MKKYSEYKDSGIDWLGEIPYNWNVSRLKFLTRQIIDGTHLTPNYIDKGVPFLRVTDIQSEFVNLEDVKYISEEEHLQLSNRCKPEKGDLLLSKNGTIGITKVVDWDWDFSIFVSLCLIKFHNEKLLSDFFSYIFKSNAIEEQIYSSSKKTSVTNLHLDKIRDLFFAFPPLAEQQNIVKFLDKKVRTINKLILKKQQMIELLKEERAAIINQAVTKGINPDAEMKDSGIEWLGEVPKHWEVKKLKYSLKLITDKNVNGSLLKIGLENIESKTGKYIETDSEFLGEGIKFSKNDLLFGKLRPYLAKVLLSEFEGNAIGDIFVYRAKEQVIPKFAFYRLLSDAFIEVINGSTFGAKMPRASSEFIGELPFPYPSINEQNAIVKYIDERITSIEKTIKITEKEIALIEEYLTALINEAVTGKIKVTESV